MTEVQTPTLVLRPMGTSQGPSTSHFPLSQIPMPTHNPVPPNPPPFPPLQCKAITCQQNPIEVDAPFPYATHISMTSVSSRDILRLCAVSHATVPQVQRHGGEQRKRQSTNRLCSVTRSESGSMKRCIQKSYLLCSGISHTRVVSQGSFHYKKSWLPFPSRISGLKMDNNDSYVGVPAASQEMIATEHHDYPIESSETHTHAGTEAPAAPNMSAPILVGPLLLSVAQKLTSCSQGMEISDNTHRNICFGCRSCIGPSHF